MEKLDNWRERGLNDMMGGVLQVRREDELKKVRTIQSNKQRKNHFDYLLRKFPNHPLPWINPKMNGQKLKNKHINNIYKK
jgi:hypothetical protein